MIDLMRSHGGAVELLNDLLESPDPAGISAITVMQLYHGVVRVGLPDDEQEKVERALKGVAVYDLSRPIAARAGQMDRDLVKRGEAIDPADVMIGATALHRDEPLVTRNKKHFARLKGLRLISY
jgi:predicted nucleic acid-binding protein